MTKSFPTLLSGAIAIAAAGIGASRTMPKPSTAAPPVAQVQPAGKESPPIQGLTAQPMEHQESPPT